MNYTEAIRLAQSGEEAGYNFLYEETYKSKYYLALKYMQNEETAKDVLQDAYIKAFAKLDTLENPEKFAAWLGMIVANTAKNALQKQNPMLFTDVAGDSEEGEFEYQIEDENVQNQPEVAYSQKETQELVRELIDTLPEEQRLCILMFHIEGESISQIAKALDCSENTVKSRLNYGRKSIKYRAEELQKKGYKLYSIAPVPFVLYLLRSEEQALAAEGTLAAAGKVMADNIASKAPQTSLLQSAGAKGAAGAVKKGFLHTLAGKAVAAGVGICIVAAGTTAVVLHNQNNNEEAIEDAGIEEDGTEEEDQGLKLEEDVKTEALEMRVGDGQYPELLEGGLTREQFEFVLAYAPESMTNGQVEMRDLSSILLRIAMDGQYYNIGIQQTGVVDGTSKPIYQLAEINNFVSVLTDYQYTEANNDNQLGNLVSGDKLEINIAEPAGMCYATIKEAMVRGDVMTVTYQFREERISDDTGEEEIRTADKVAILHKTGNERYRITDIIDARMAEGKESAYRFLLENLYTNRVWPDGTIMDLMGSMEENTFAVYDVDGDGEDELIINYTSGSMAGMRVAIYGYDSEIGNVHCELSEFPALAFYDNGFIRADWSHNQSDNPDQWPYTMYQYDPGSDTYKEIGMGETNTGSVEGYVGNGREVELSFRYLTEENIQSIK